MDKRIKKWLLDIQETIKTIESYFEGEEKDFNKYIQNGMRKKAVERNLEIIGEAVNRILNFDETYAEKISDARPIVNLRNYIIHSYDSVSDENIWSILITHLPKLKTEVENLLIHNNT
ncbi:MAG: DUF86 domain-containing protein [Flavobacteriaceae bacterium]|nr:DUF86 domain-containing protein [Flavobacteriaceae bacterium]